jgi:hypothetical protein
MTVLLHRLGSARRALLFFFLLLLVIAGSGELSCGEASVSSDRPAVQALRRSFPDQAGAVLAPPGEGGVATAEGFVLGATAASSQVLVDPLHAATERQGAGGGRL